MPRYTRTALPEDEAAPRHPAISQLRPAIRTVRHAFAPARRVQLNWIVTELAAAMDLGDVPAPARADARQLVTETVLLDFLARADADAYRPRNRALTRGPSVHSARARRTVLRHIARAYGQPVKLDSPRPPLPRDDLPTPHQRAGLWSFVASAHMYAGTTTRRSSLIRLAAIIGVVLDTGGRSGEIARLQLDDLAPDLWHITLGISPQNNRAAEPERVRFRLSLKTRNALAYWIAVRKELVPHHQGGKVTALWVTVRAGGWSGRATPGKPTRPVHTVGMPLSRETVTAAYSDAVRWLNTHRYDDPTWEPIPNTLERLRLTSNPIVAKDQETGPPPTLGLDAPPAQTPGNPDPPLTGTDE